jgi:hypothetical protein
MNKLTVLIIIVSLRILFHPGTALASPAPFTNHSAFYSTDISNSARVISVSANVVGDKIFLNWVVSENETVDMFEVEKSTDGRHFRTAALVFGTDNAFTANYLFYENAGPQRFVYRIKLINKDKKTAYSPVFKISHVV